MFSKWSDKVEKMLRESTNYGDLYYICTKIRQDMKDKTGEYASSGYLLHQMSDLIEERGTMVIDFSSSMIVENKELISPYSVVALCHRGSIDSEFDMKPVEFGAHDISVMRPGHVIKNYGATADYSTQLIVTHAASLNSMRQQYLSHHLADH